MVDKKKIKHNYICVFTEFRVTKPFMSTILTARADTRGNTRTPSLLSDSGVCVIPSKCIIIYMLS